MHLPEPKIAGMSLVAERPHKNYYSDILIQDDLKIEHMKEYKELLK